MSCLWPDTLALTRPSLPLVSALSLGISFFANLERHVEFDDLQPLSFDAPLKISPEHEFGVDPVRYSTDQMEEDTHETIAELPEILPCITLSPTLAAADTNMDLPPSSPSQSYDDLFSGTLTPDLLVTAADGGDVRGPPCGVCGGAYGMVNRTSY